MLKQNVSRNWPIPILVTSVLILICSGSSLIQTSLLWSWQRLLRLYSELVSTLYRTLFNYSNRTYNCWQNTLIQQSLFFRLVSIWITRVWICENPQFCSIGIYMHCSYNVPWHFIFEFDIKCWCHNLISVLCMIIEFSVLKSCIVF